MQTYLISVCASLLIGGVLFGGGMWKYMDGQVKALRTELTQSQEANKTLETRLTKEQETCTARLASKDATIKRLRGINEIVPKKDDNGNIMPDDPLLSELNGLYKTGRQE